MSESLSGTLPWSVPSALAGSGRLGISRAAFASFCSDPVQTFGSASFVPLFIRSWLIRGESPAVWGKGVPRAHLERQLWV